ncbi:efflux RND transporter periplasmic adaptor subunit [Marinagarivorans algicola]|uniref:efflux RND transporter periplasmic adaptor subunit n=1 Tax=Marinagarivorans algicola TaxID=1513270 RepID=UPI0006B630B3|nr:efflux RND transporter periplasmic adaptor subunit [Marinagarivorans algicola]
MNKLLIVTTCTAVVGAFLLGRNSLAPAAPPSPITVPASVGVPLVAPKPKVWSCAMHPHIQQAEAGQCPICGMDLIQSAHPSPSSNPQHTQSEAHNNPTSLQLDPEAMALAEIQTTQVTRQYPEAEVRLVGKLGYDETRIKSLTARFPMRIDELFVSFVGVPVTSGQHLAHIYSPQLRIAQNDLLGAYRLDKNSTLTQSAKEKLRLWGLLPSQINAIIQRNTAQDEFELKAPISGVVVQKNINNGDYLKTGQSLFTIVDLHNLWLSLEAFESDLAWLRLGQPVRFSVDAYPGETFNGNITFIHPEVDASTRTVSIRVNVPNPHKKLKPGMFANAVVRPKIALAGKVYAPELIGKWISPMHPEIIKDKPGQCDICGMDLVPAEALGYYSANIVDPTHPNNTHQSAPLVIPASAILHTGKRAIVYVQTKNSPPTFEGRQIILGPRAGDVYIVNHGLNAGEHIVSHGAFKIDSALQIQAKPSMMNPVARTQSQVQTHVNNDTHTHTINTQPSPSVLDHSSHNHSSNDHSINHYDANNNSSDSHKQGPNHQSEVSLTQLEYLLPLYFELQMALANDELALAKKYLNSALAIPQLPQRLSTIINAMLASPTLNDLRLPHFETLSNYMMQAVNLYRAQLQLSVYQMYCPMAYPNRGANWLQQTPDIQNPYFGHAMLKCGQNKALLTTSQNPQGEVVL